MDFLNYKTEGFYDELFASDGVPRASAKLFIDRIQALSREALEERQKAAELALLNLGITFTVNGDEGGVERIFPFDVIPRVIGAEEWVGIKKGLKQRIRALNLFLDDIYHDQKILADGCIPQEVILTGKSFLRECIGLNPPQGIWCHITGTDLVRGQDGTFYVLEDNLRCPSGVSYVIENRRVLKQSFPRVFANSGVCSVDDYPTELLRALEFVSPSSKPPLIVVLSPGIYNSAYFEHTFLAQQIGAQLVEGSDLVVDNDQVWMRTTYGFEKVDVIYRRIDDTFLDPHVFRKDSLLGVPGMMKAYQAGNVALANAPGTGIADDKVVYKFVPEMIRYYLQEEPLLPNVPTYLCLLEKERAYVLEHLEELVVKSANEAGGYGMLIGPASTKKEREIFAEKIKADPRNYLAQPVVALSRVPTMTENGFEGRHVDLRPYILYGEDIYVMPGGLTRVALKKGSLVVNSSQGGGSKDTWVLKGPNE